MSINLGIDEIRPAVVTIDLHRGHLDPTCATVPLSAEASARVVEANRRFLDNARAAGVPIIHVVTYYRDESETASNPFWNAIADTAVSRGNVRRHNLEGMPGLEIMPGLYSPSTDRVVRTKKRYNCFLGTDLDFVLRNSLGVNTLLITGVNTNSCVLTTTITAQTMDYAAIVVEECVDTCDGPDFHRMAVEIIRRAFGWVMSGDEALKVVAGQKVAVGAAR